MRAMHLSYLAVAFCILPGAAVEAQQSPAATPPAAAPAATPAREIPRPDQLEPGVNTTTAAGPSGAETPPAAPPAATAAPAAGARTPSGAPPPAVAPPETTAARKSGTPAKTAAPKGVDRLELDTTDITGNRELPKVLYIVPWKRSDLGDIVGRPVNSLLDEVLQPLDRDVFQRENRYYNALKPGQDAPKTGTAQGSESQP